MKKIFTLLIFVTLLASCGKNSSSSSSDSNSGSSSEISTSDSGSSSESSESSLPNTSSEEGSSSQTSESSENNSSEGDGSSSSSSEVTPPVEVLRSISDIRAVAATFDQKLVNDRGVYTSNIKAEITAQLLTLQDYGTTKEGYNGKYKALVANETGVITVTIPDTAYDSMSEFKQEKQVYTFSGVVGLANDEVEIDMGNGAAPKRHVGVSLDYDYRTFAKAETSIANLRTTVLANDLKLNVKGIGWKQDIYKMDLEYIDKVVNATALFSDGVNIIEVHGHDKINNIFTKGHTYTIYGRPGLYNFRPELEFIGHESSAETITLSFAGAPQISAAQIFGYSYLIDKDTDYLLAKNKQYGAIVNNVYYFEGYVNLYDKSGKIHFLLEDSYCEDPRSSEAAAFTAKSLSIKNDDSRNLDDRGFTASPFYEFYNSGEKIGVYLTPHSYSKVAWDVYALSAPFAVE